MKEHGRGLRRQYGWAATDADYFLKLDSEMEILHPGWLKNLVQFFKPSSNVGAVAYKVIPDGALPAMHFGPTAIFETEYSGGACLLTSREMRNMLWNFCEDYGVYEEEDSDFGVCVGLTGRKNISVDGTGHVLHNTYNGYKIQMKPVKSRLARKRNIEQFQSNVYAYDTGLRPLRVGRRLLPVHYGDSFTCTLYEMYKREALVWNRYRKVVTYATRDIVSDHLAKAM